MSTAMILAPLFVQVLLTFAVMFGMMVFRTRTLQSGETRFQDIAMREPNWPRRPAQFANSFSNQFELPVLFYVLTILAMFTKHADFLFVVLAWNLFAPSLFAQVQMPDKAAGALWHSVGWRSTSLIRDKAASSRGVVTVMPRLVERQPLTSWNQSQPSEYGFYSNVNPDVDHPRWSQATERRIGAGLLAGAEQAGLLLEDERQLAGLPEDRVRQAAEAAQLALEVARRLGAEHTILADGAIERGGQNLPGNWEGRDFNLAERVTAAIPRIGEHPTMVVMHNDAVVQGLSEAPFMTDVKRWGVLTIGTGLGNARFTNREDD
mgnify:CR=1 FL=1